MKTPPKGFNSVLMRQAWKGVIDFSRAVGAELATSVATSAGTRDADGSGCRRRPKPSCTARRA
jgi:hypothetical protein